MKKKETMRKEISFSPCRSSSSFYGWEMSNDMSERLREKGMTEKGKME